MNTLTLAIGAAALAGTAALLITPLTSALAVRFGIMDRPEASAHKSHEQATPYLGGIAILCGLLCGCIAMLFVGEGQQGGNPRGLMIGIGLAVGLGLVGLLDDVRDLPRLARLGAQVLAALAAWEVGFRVQAAPWGALNLLITVAWIVGITNSFNLLDNMDGLTAGLAGVGAVSFAILSMLGGLETLTVVSSALAGAAFGFLAHNRAPAKVFMGDAGSLLLGFLVALIGVKLKFDNLVKITFLIPVVVLSIPILDTTLVVLSRIKAGRSPFEGGRDHISHRLVRVGLPVKAAVGLLYWGGLCLGWLGLVISRSNTQVGWMLLGFVIALCVFFGALLWKVPVYDAITAPLEDKETRREALKSEAR